MTIRDWIDEVGIFFKLLFQDAFQSLVHLMLRLVNMMKIILDINVMGAQIRGTPFYLCNLK